MTNGRRRALAAPLSPAAPPKRPPLRFLQVVHGTHDEVVPFSNGQDLHAACGKYHPLPPGWIEGATHNNLETVHSIAYLRAFKAFLKHLLERPENTPPPKQGGWFDWLPGQKSSTPTTTVSAARHFRALFVPAEPSCAVGRSTRHSARMAPRAVALRRDRPARRCPTRGPQAFRPNLRTSSLVITSCHPASGQHVPRATPHLSHRGLVI